MSGEAGGGVIQWPGPVHTEKPSVHYRLECVLALFHAITAGELLAALPECSIAQAQHRAGLTLLAMAEKELLSLHETVKA